MKKARKKRTITNHFINYVARYIQKEMNCLEREMIQSIFVAETTQ